MTFKKFRKMKVYEASGYNYKRTPSIILKGDWLKETGFDVGGLIQVECEDGKLIITPREPEMVEYHAVRGKVILQPQKLTFSLIGSASCMIEIFRAFVSGLNSS